LANQARLNMSSYPINAYTPYIIVKIRTLV
jgi:hypothetical protein